MAVKTAKATVNQDGGLTVQVWADKDGMTQERAEMAAQLAFDTVCKKGLREVAFDRPEKNPASGPHHHAVWKFLADGKTIIPPKAFAGRKTVHKHHPNQCPNAGHLGPGPWPCDLCQLEGGAE